MSKRKRKNTITLVSLLLALVVLVVFYLWYSAKDKTDTGTKLQANDEYELATLDTSLLQSIQLQNEHLDMVLVYEDNIWRSQEDGERPINQSNINKMIRIFSKVVASKKIAVEGMSLSDFGLEKPSVEVKVTQTDGIVLDLKIGIKTVDGTGSYALVNEDGNVYILDSKFGTGFMYTELEMTSVEDAPGIESTSIYHILVTQKNGENFELLYDVNNSADKTQKGYYPWIILQPYTEGLSADGSKVSKLLPYFADMNFHYCVDYVGEDRESYGLEDPSATILVKYYVQYRETLEEPMVDPNTGQEITETTYTEEKSFTLSVGNKNEEGFYYVGTDVSNRIYTMEAEKVELMLQVEPFNYISSYVFLPHIDSISKIEIEIDGELYTMEMTRKSVTNEAGEKSEEITYYYNGEVTYEDVFKDVYQVIISSTYDTMVGEVNNEKRQPYVTITFYLNNGKTDKATYIPYNNSFYLIEKDDHIRFFADKRRVDRIASAVIEFVEIED